MKNALISLTCSAQYFLQEARRKKHDADKMRVSLAPGRMYSLIFRVCVDISGMLVCYQMHVCTYVLLSERERGERERESKTAIYGSNQRYQILRHAIRRCLCL